MERVFLREKAVFIVYSDCFFQAHQWVLDNMDKWVEKYLIADNSLRIRNGKFYY